MAGRGVVRMHARTHLQRGSGDHLQREEGRYM